MSLSTNGFITGTFTSAAAPTAINIPSGVSEFQIIDVTNLGGTSNFIRGTWMLGMPNGSAFTEAGAAGPTLAAPAYITSGGVTVVPNSRNLTVSAPIATSAVTAANPGVVSTGTTSGLVAGQSIVRIINQVGMQQISSVDFTVGTISAGVSFQLKFLDTTNFISTASAGQYVILPISAQTTAPFDYTFYPKRRFIANILKSGGSVGGGGTLASGTTRVTLTVTHGFTVGQKVRVVVPGTSSPFISGTNGYDGQIATVTAIGNNDASSITNTIDLNFDSSSFGTYQWPTSATAAAGVTFPQIVPVGEAATTPWQNLLDDATRNLTYTGVQLGTSVQGASGHLMQWFAKYGIAIS